MAPSGRSAGKITKHRSNGRKLPHPSTTRESAQMAALVAAVAEPSSGGPQSEYPLPRTSHATNENNLEVHRVFSDPYAPQRFGHPYPFHATANEPTGHPLQRFLMPHPGQYHHIARNRTATEASLEFHGVEVKVDSALSKKLAGEIALREPVQRRPEQSLNIERRSNVEALFAHMTGRPADVPCKNCYKGHGPWTSCIIYEGQMCGSCSNCWYNASGSRCTFHDNNVPRPFPPTPQPPLLPLQPLSQQSQQSQLSDPSPVPTPTWMNPNYSMPQSSHLDNDVSVSGLRSDIYQWGLVDRTSSMVSSAMTSATDFSRKRRYVARIEAAAEELAMRLTEYEEFLRSSEGLEKQSSEQRPSQTSSGSMSDESQSLHDSTELFSG